MVYYLGPRSKILAKPSCLDLAMRGLIGWLGRKDTRLFTWAVNDSTLTIQGPYVNELAHC